ncbi:MAG: CPBP family intramembrane metalloprotease [Clostridium sp.]|nr:CPBP family intramembrane metalloprotease [Clostridium sp.]MCM1171112.1 CPBP family intramembrane metalloprotease [Clostridium sp.]MCM1209716.1 CPBP family intramembrane metalloprotease [Ruminococcus sp.]
MKKEYNITISKAFFLTAAYFGIMLFYTFLDVAFWRKIAPKYSNVLNMITISICIVCFILLLKKTGYELQLLSNITFMGIILAVCCSVLFFLLLDKCLDPVFESMFPQSEQDYQQTIQSLITAPITSLIQVCLLAPVIEEILMRGVVLGGLKHTYGILRALIISSALFGLLHFNMVQTLSAFVCGIVLGLLYIKTNCIFCCILAHCGYNLISYCVLILPYINK